MSNCPPLRILENDYYKRYSLDLLLNILRILSPPRRFLCGVFSSAVFPADGHVPGDSATKFKLSQIIWTIEHWGISKKTDKDAWVEYIISKR